jgi:toxin ParE1/3/4
MSFRLRPLAVRDLDDIVGVIADDNPAAALAWVDNILQRCRKLGESPGMGVERPDVRKGLRLFPVGRYLILYESTPDGVEVVRVLHGARQWQDLL